MLGHVSTMMVTGQVGAAPPRGPACPPALRPAEFISSPPRPCGSIPQVQARAQAMRGRPSCLRPPPTPEASVSSMAQARVTLSAGHLRLNGWSCGAEGGESGAQVRAPLQVQGAERAPPSRLPGPVPPHLQKPPASEPAGTHGLQGRVRAPHPAALRGTSRSRSRKSPQTTCPPGALLSLGCQ